jgi:hypothetical protein
MLALLFLQSHPLAVSQAAGKAKPGINRCFVLTTKSGAELSEPKPSALQSFCREYNQFYHSLINDILQPMDDVRKNTC